MDVFDVVILGAGSAAASAVDPLRTAGRTVAVVSAGRVGGECSYVACIPSKAMLHSARVNALMHTASVASARVDLAATEDDVAAYRRAVERRDRLAHHRDDTKAAERLTELDATLIRGRGRITRPNVVQVGNEQFGTATLSSTLALSPPFSALRGWRTPTLGRMTSVGINCIRSAGSRPHTTLQISAQNTSQMGSTRAHSAGSRPAICQRKCFTPLTIYSVP
jgi:hypothetical protein